MRLENLLSLGELSGATYGVIYGAVNRQRSRNRGPMVGILHHKAGSLLKDVQYQINLDGIQYAFQETRPANWHMR